MEKLGENWYSELSPLWPGQCFSLKVDEILHQEKTSFQDILVFKSQEYGRVLVLDGAIQCTERDEFSYQEMIAFIPLTVHPSPKNVLVIGGGDGGVAREIAKDPRVEKITLCEIDERVIEVSKQFLPFMSQGFSSSKLEVKICNGVEFLCSNREEYDIIITDSSDPLGPAEVLFQESFYSSIQSALKPDGLMCCQGECFWLHLDLIKDIMGFCSKKFPVVDYAYTSIPTYPCGQIGFLLCSKNPATDFRKPLWHMSEEEQENLQLRYYSPEVHQASFVLPRFAEKVLKYQLMERTSNSNVQNGFGI